MSDDRPFDPIRPDDPDEQLLYVRRLQWRFPEETAGIDEAQLRAIVTRCLPLCTPLQINDPNDVVRFLALDLFITVSQRKSMLLNSVIKRVIAAVEVWTAKKRLDFIYAHVVGRPPPDPEPDFGPWFVDDPESVALLFAHHTPSAERA